MDRRLKLRNCIASGGCGQVFLARQEHLDRDVAVKILRPELSGDPVSVARFHREARAAGRIHSPYVIAIFDLGVTRSGLIYLVMEYVPGEPLAELIAREGPLSVGRAVHLIGQALRGLAAAHEVGVVHADVTTGNCLVQRGIDGNEQLKVIDFGISRLLEDTPPCNLVCGTPEYIAPEVVLGEPPDERADIYGAGAVLYEMLTGTPPFTGMSPIETATKQVRDPVEPLRKRRPELEIPHALEGILLRALAKSPADRYANATAFRAALERAVPAASHARARAAPSIATTAVTAKWSARAVRPAPVTPAVHTTRRLQRRALVVG